VCQVWLGDESKYVHARRSNQADVGDSHAWACSDTAKWLRIARLTFGLHGLAGWLSRFGGEPNRRRNQTAKGGGRGSGGEGTLSPVRKGWTDTACGMPASCEKRPCLLV